MDSYCWSGSNHGLYTVKSGYDLSSRQLPKEMFHEAQEQPSVNPIFQGIWSLYTAPNIKVFLWKAVKGAVAVEDRLRTRGILIEDGCSMCPEENETINHILFQCPLARQVWALSLLQSPFSGFGNSSFTNMNHVLHNCKNQSISRFLRSVSPWIIWIFWKNINKVLFEGDGSVSHSIVHKAYEDCNHWLSAQDPNSQTEETKKGMKWIPPPQNELKCNIGVAWSRKTQLAGVSWVVRDDTGKVLLHSRRSYSQSMDQLHLDRVTFGASSHDIIKAMNKPKEWPALRGHLDALIALTLDKPHWYMAMEIRQCNTGANEIAKSVITGMRWQSYVARGSPHWLHYIFDSELVQ
ncbi:putative reverse transcriptase zinc-binding domain-containing protein [Arabidopsis thaliana]